jgi:hypothetical protein
MPLRSRERWNALSDKYKARLARHGITEERYLSGEPLTGARGHGKTPEHPREAQRHPERFPEYVARKTGVPLPTYTDRQVIDRVKQILMQAFMSGQLERIDVTTIEDHVRRMDTATRIQVMGMDADEYRERARYQQPKNRKSPAMPWFVRVGDHWENPFWYH